MTGIDVYSQISHPMRQAGQNFHFFCNWSTNLEMNLTKFYTAGIQRRNKLASSKMRKLKSWEAHKLRSSWWHDPWFLIMILCLRGAVDNQFACHACHTCHVSHMGQIISPQISCHACHACHRDFVLEFFKKTTKNHVTGTRNTRMSHLAVFCPIMSHICWKYIRNAETLFD